MTVTMDNAGRIVIPKEIRKEAGLQPGVPLELRYEDGVVEIQSKPVAVRLERRGRLVVAVPLTEVPVVTSEQVERVLDEMRFRHTPQLKKKTASRRRKQ